MPHHNLWSVSAIDTFNHIIATLSNYNMSHQKLDALIVGKIISRTPEGGSVIFYQDKKGHNLRARHATQEETDTLEEGVLYERPVKAVRKRTRLGLS